MVHVMASLSFEHHSVHRAPILFLFHSFNSYPILGKGKCVECESSIHVDGLQRLTGLVVREFSLSKLPIITIMLKIYIKKRM